MPNDSLSAAEPALAHLVTSANWEETPPPPRRLRRHIKAQPQFQPCFALQGHPCLVNNKHNCPQEGLTLWEYKGGSLLTGWWDSSDTIREGDACYKVMRRTCGIKYNISDGIKENASSPKLGQIWHDPALPQVVGDHTASRRQASFDVRLHVQASIHSFLC